MNARTISMKVLGSLALLAGLSTMSGCIVVARPAPARAVYVEPARTVVVQPSRTVYVEPARRVYYR